MPKKIVRSPRLKAYQNFVKSKMHAMRQSGMRQQDKMRAIAQEWRKNI